MGNTEKSYVRMPVMILAGGRGTRLGKTCEACSKPMLPVMGKPFLAYLVDYLQSKGFRRIIFLGGYLSEQIEEYFGAGGNPDFAFVNETMPLGTGGAVYNAIRTLNLKEPFLLVNGDSFTTFSAEDFTVHNSSDAAILGLRVDDASRYGTLSFDNDGRLIALNEKKFSGRGVINAGVYSLDPKLFKTFSKDTFYSIEKDFFPLWLREGRNIRVTVRDYPFIDIGTPESLESSKSFLKSLKMESGL